MERNEADAVSETFRDLADLAARLPTGWRGKRLASLAAIELKLFRVDAAGLSAETHDDYAEALLMLDGAIDLMMDGNIVSLSGGDMQIIGRGSMHAILPGGTGSFLLLDPEALGSEAGVMKDFAR